MRMHSSARYVSRARRASRACYAFTITELLVVILIIALLIAIAVPAFSGLMGSSERSLAENQLRAAIAAARYAAIQSESGDAAAVFLFSVSNGVGRITVVPCLVVGQLQDVDDNTQPPSATNLIRTREVLAPIPSVGPTQLPRGWSVRAYAAPGTVYDPTHSQPEFWYEAYDSASGMPSPGVGQWVFPETAFYDVAKPKVGTVRQSFMVRFKAGTGALDTSSGGTALVFAPALESSFRSAAPYSRYRADQLRIDTVLAPNAAAWVRRMLGDRTEFINAAQLQSRRFLLGDASLDTVMVRPVSELALFQEQRMAAAIGASALNRATGTIYGNIADPNGVPTQPTIDTTLFSAGITAADVNTRVTEWIEGRYHQNDQPSSALVASDARVFTVEHYLGQVQELVP